MKAFKKIVLTTAILAAFSSFSSTYVFAEENKDKNLVVRQAAEGTISKLEEAAKIADGHGDKAQIAALLNEARQLQKEFRYEQTERQRQKANEKLRAAREFIEQGDVAQTGVAVKEALVIFKEMMSIYAAGHK